MAWKPEYAANRRRKYRSDPAERERRLGQSRSGDTNREYMREYYRANPEKWKLSDEERERRNAARRDRYANDPEYRAECIRLSKLRDKESIRDYRLRKEYGITAQEYDDIAESQGGRCAICGVTSADNTGRRLAVDHCHDTGLVRGLLCSPCNMAIGLLGDDPIRLSNAIAYLAGTVDRVVRAE
jgi:hypothetical protein